MLRTQQQQQAKVELSTTALVKGARDVYKGMLSFKMWTNGEAEAIVASFDKNSEALATTESWIPQEDTVGKELIARLKELDLSFGNITCVANELHTDDMITVIESRHDVQRRNTANDLEQRFQNHAAECKVERETLCKVYSRREAQLRKEYALMAAKIHNDIAILEKQESEKSVNVKKDPADSENSATADSVQENTSEQAEAETEAATTN